MAFSLLFLSTLAVTSANADQKAYLKAPEIAEQANGMVPITIIFEPALSSGQSASLKIENNKVTSFNVLRGSLNSISLRMYMPRTGRVHVEGGGISSEPQIIKTIMENPVTPHSNTIDLAKTKSRFQAKLNEMKIVMNGYFQSGTLNISSQNFEMNIDGTPFLSLNQFLAISGSIHSGDSLQYRLIP